MKSKVVHLRMDERLYKFVKDVARKNNKTISEFIRDIVIYFNMGSMVGELNKTFGELREEFINKYEKHKNNVVK